MSETRARLVAALEDIVHTITSSRRQRDRVEAPEPLTGAYVGFVLANAFIRLGEPARATTFVEQARRALAPYLADPIHDWISHAFEVRIQQQELPAKLLSDVAELGRVERYKVDRLCEAVPGLGRNVDAIHQFSRQPPDPPPTQPRPWESITDLDARAAYADELVDEAMGSGADAARLLADSFAALTGLPESQAMPILVRAIPMAAGLGDPELSAEALVLAARFGWGELAAGPTQSIRAKVRAQTNPSGLANALLVGLRALCRLGMRLEVEEILEDAEVMVARVPTGPARDEIWLVVGGRPATIGNPRARPIFEQAHERFEDARRSNDRMSRLALMRAIATGYGLAAIGDALAGVARLARVFGEITDAHGTNSHYCFSVVHFVASLVLVLENQADASVRQS